MYKSLIYLTDLNINKSVLLIAIYNTEQFTLNNREISKALDIPISAVNTIIKSLVDDNYIHINYYDKRHIVLLEMSIIMIENTIKRKEKYDKKYNALINTLNQNLL